MVLNIALIGYGKMGRLIEKLAVEKGHRIVATISPSSKTREISQKTISNADICIDFSHPDAALDNIHSVSAAGKNLVMGTTGWLEHLPTAEKVVRENKTALFHSANFSIGMNLFMHIVQEAANVMSRFDQYDTALLEEHHNKKVDTPSGTAKEIAKILNQKRNKDVLISSLRCGHIPGTHTVLFDSVSDTITLQHTARNREGFALGAITAAEWLVGKKGIFTFDDFWRQK